MTINYSNEKVLKNQKSIFLAGPTPRSKDVTSWRVEAIKILQELDFDGVVYVPKNSDLKPKESLVDQANWEREALEAATVIVFWVPRSLDKMPAFTTNVEFGFWMHSDKVIYGRPISASKIAYLDWLYDFEKQKKPYDNLTDLLKSAIRLVDELDIIKKKTIELENILSELLDINEFYQKVSEKLTSEEYQYIKKHLKGKCCNNCTNGCCDIPSYEKDGLDELGKPQGHDCLGWNNYKLVGRAKVLQKYDITGY